MSLWRAGADVGVQSTPQPDAEYSLFGGGVNGKFVSLSPPKEFVQTWALSSPTWPSGEYMHDHCVRALF